jgi:hypothetical protein
VPVIAVERDRPFLLDAVEVTRCCLEAIIEKLYRFQPIIRASRFLGEALLNLGLERFERRRLASDLGETALRAADRAVDRVDVCVDQSGKNQFPAKVDLLCLPLFDHQLDLVIIANGDNAVACEGDRLLDRARRVGRVVFPFQSTTSAFSTWRLDIFKPETGNEANDNR